jgi:hypothetical protein
MRKHRRMGRKGFVFDVITIIVAVFMLALVGVLCYYLLDQVQQALSVDPNTGDTANGILNWGVAKYPGIIDGLVALFIIGLPLVSAGLAYYLEVSSIFMWLMLGVVILFIIFGAILSNMWDSIMTSNPTFQGYMIKFALTNFIMSNYAMYALFATILVMGGIFLKTQTQGAY